MSENLSDGDIIIEAVGRANALDDMEKIGDNRIWIWSANAQEQIEGALDQLGYKLVKK